MNRIEDEAQAEVNLMAAVSKALGMGLNAEAVRAAVEEALEEAGAV